jgi:hypothetical protein
MQASGAAYRHIRALHGGLEANRDELDALIHVFQRVALEAIAAATPPDLLFDEHELAALDAIDRAATQAIATASTPAMRLAIEDARLGCRNFVFMSARQRSGAPSTAHWYRGRAAGRPMQTPNRGETCCE